MDWVVGGKYRVGCKLAVGSCGHVYRGSDLETGAEVAVKVESVRASHMRLLHEAKLCKLLEGSVGIPTVHWYGVEGDKNVAVFDLLGPSLQDLFDYRGCKFSLRTVLMLAEQMISRIECLHSKGLLHRNIKPGHFVIGLGAKGNLVHLIDFGLAHCFCDARDCDHAQLEKNLNLVGAPRYISTRAHRGLKQSRLDDLESLGYVLVYFLRGRLPWQGLRGNTVSEKHKLILEKKLSTSMYELCHSAPREFAELCAYSERLQGNDCPDYAYLKRSLRHAFFRLGYHCGSPFDWTPRSIRSEASRASSKTLQCVIEQSFDQAGQNACTSECLARGSLRACGGGMK
eukprot:TRINITY_DN10941_c0_g1_i1.p1 TRINITY_DN10941_c0_g1~~TRINITY_DN10941_c0_g1_i1.p1  ORF type:complete len:361 (+),score=24.57 TRINITY_DN10941_c0_g1_i1:60-1085(+)